MGEPYTIRMFVPEGDPEGTKVIELLNWTGVGVAFPRAAWPRVCGRPEFRRAGVYILSGTAEGTSDDRPTVYVGQADEVVNRIQAHYDQKEFWDWAYVFGSSAGALNRAHVTWLEQQLIQLASNAERCHLDNTVHPKEPGLSESDRADTRGFLREMLRILPLLGVRVFEMPAPVATPGHGATPRPAARAGSDTRDTIVVPAQGDGFRAVFLGSNCWYAIRIGGGMIDQIKYIAAYQTAPISAVTHYAPVDRIEPYGDEGKYKLVFAQPAKALPKSIPFADATTGSMQGPRYTSLTRLLAAGKVADLLTDAAS